MPKIKGKRIKQIVDAGSGDNKLFFWIGGFIIILVVVLLFVKLNSSDKIENGSLVTMNYIGYLPDGTIFSTSIESVGLQAGLDETDYEPFSFTVGNQEVISGFEEEILEMSIGEKKTFTLTPDKAYGEVREELFRAFLRDLNLSRDSSLSLEDYETIFDKAPILDDVVNVSRIPWDFKVINIIDGNVTVEALLDVGDRLQLPDVGWETVVVEEDGSFILRQYPNVGDYISTADNPKFARITEVNDTMFVADANSQLAGKTLTFEVTLLSVEKTAG